ncbi:dihydrofolate reductase [Rhodohalobacter halophilus]|uniref:dihydrofolate reductase n=1 Tax=Rhodohalobacter halophilus TaxID=1812810 RepID=UPI00083FBA70|nr:dihydrofolate reductase [Rhodohalobacter halophilus]
MKIVLIVAHDPNLVIGNEGGLPWHYSEDLKFFKKETMGHPIVMGRIVFEELNEKPLPGRENIVLSRTKSFEHVKTFKSIEEALDNLRGHEKVFIIGGGEIYKQTLDMADELIVTQIKVEYSGDTFFPEYQDKIGTVWREYWREEHSAFDFVKLKKV